MSCYLDIYKDLPSRCLKLWDQIEQIPGSNKDDLSVTTMLVIAAAGFAMPWEHLKHNSPNAEKALWKSHPSFKSVSERDYGEALKKLNTEFSKSLGNSDLVSKKGETFWRMATCLDLKEVRDVGEYNEGVMLEPEECKIRLLLKCLRNALAHNNVCAFGGAGGEIDRLSFFSEKVSYDENRVKTLEGWYVATTTVEGFRHFLKGWFSLVSSPSLRLVTSEAISPEPERIAA